MARVLKITSGLMGLLLLVMVGVLGAGRNFPENSEWMILMTYGPERSHLRKTSPDGETTIIAEFGRDFGISHLEGFWAYGWLGGKHQFGRVNLLTGEKQSILATAYREIYGRIVSSHDGRIIVYTTGGGLLYRVLADGGKRQRVSPQDVFVHSDFGLGVAFLDDDSLLFDGSDSSESRPQLLWLNPDGTLRYGLEANLPELFFAPPHQDWVVVADYRERDDPLYWVSIDGGELHPIPVVVSVGRNARMEIVGDDLLVLQTEAELIAFYRDATEPLWRIPNASLESISSDGQVALVSQGHFLSLMDMVTGKPIWMVSGVTEWQWSPDQQAVYYIVTRRNGDYELRRLGRNVSGYTKLLDSPKRMNLIDWTADGEWLMVQVYDKRIHVRADGSQTQDKGFWWNRAFVGWWPDHNSAWSALPLAAVAVMFIFIPPLILKTRLQQRGRI